MNTELHKTPTPPEGARYLRVGEKAQAGDLLWHVDESAWHPISVVHGDTTIHPEQFGYYCRRVI